MVSIAQSLRTLVETKVSPAIAADVTVNFGNGLPKAVYFEHGTPMQIVQLLMEYSGEPSKANARYPMIALIRNFVEEDYDDGRGISSKADVRIIICSLTNPDYRPDDRERQSFDKVLKPIYNEFINQLQQSPVFGMPNFDSLRIKRIDQYAWGKEQVVNLPDYIDAIDLQRISLNVHDIAVCA